MPGEKWDQEIHERLSTAGLVLLLISVDFIASDSQPVKSAASLDLTGSALPLCQSRPAHRSEGRPTP